MCFKCFMCVNVLHVLHGRIMACWALFLYLSFFVFLSISVSRSPILCFSVSMSLSLILCLSFSHSLLSVVTYAIAPCLNLTQFIFGAQSEKSPPNRNNFYRCFECKRCPSFFSRCPFLFSSLLSFLPAIFMPNCLFYSSFLSLLPSCPILRLFRQ